MKNSKIRQPRKLHKMSVVRKKKEQRNETKQKLVKQGSTPLKWRWFFFLGEGPGGGG
jgi:hypothetical protein